MAFLALSGFLVSSSEILSNPDDFNSFSKLTNSVLPGALDSKKTLTLALSKICCQFTKKIKKKTKKLSRPAILVDSFRLFDVLSKKKSRGATASYITQSAHRTWQRPWGRLNSPAFTSVSVWVTDVRVPPSDSWLVPPPPPPQVCHSSKSK